MNKSFFIVWLLIVTMLVTSGCNENARTGSLVQSGNTSLTHLSSQVPSNSNIIPTGIPSDNGSDSSETLSKEADFDPDSVTIGLYAGAGSWDVNVEAFRKFFDFYGYKWEEIDQNNLKIDGYLSKFDLIWFPGGYAAQYRTNISEQGHSNIRKYVEEGGYFAGSCAGAYFASDIMRWHGKERQYPLKIFPGKAIGPLAGLVAWGKISVCNLNENIFGKNFSLAIPIYYFDGPYFEPDDAVDVEVLAWYEVNEKAAVVSGDYGSGRYLLFGPHPELGAYTSSTLKVNVDGEQGAQWAWLDKSLRWFFTKI